MTTTTTSLDLLAEKIKSAIDRSSKSRVEWIKASLDLCVHLAEARAAFADNISFGKWFDAADIDLNAETRAAAITMGQEPDRLRLVLAGTSRSSLRHIYEREFRLCHVAKTPELPFGSDCRPVKKAKPLNAQRERAFAAYDRIKAAGETMTWEAIRAEAGVSATVVRAIIIARETEEKVKAQIAPEIERARLVEERTKLIDELDAARMAQISAMSPVQRKRFDARVAAYRQELAVTVAAQVQAGITKWTEETGIALYMKRLEKLETMLTSPLGAIMHKAEYNVILRCLHPDTGHSRTDQERAEAFRLFTHYKLKMVNDEEERINARRELRSSLPKTLSEMLARRKTRA